MKFLCKVAHLATLGYNLHALEHKSNLLKECTFEEPGLAPLFLLRIVQAVLAQLSA